MNLKRVVGITLTVIVLLLLAAGVRMAQSPGISVAEAPRIPPAQSAKRCGRGRHQTAVAAPAARSTARTAPDTGAVTTTQTFTLQAGWNAIYLEVEPINTSPLVNIGPQRGPGHGA